jgi:hypothetical protein
MFASKRAAGHLAVAAPTVGAGLRTTFSTEPIAGESRWRSFKGGDDDASRNRRTWPTAVVIDAPRAGALNESV